MLKNLFIVTLLNYLNYIYRVEHIFLHPLVLIHTWKQFLFAEIQVHFKLQKCKIAKNLQNFPKIRKYLAMSTMNVGEYQHGEPVEVHEYSHISVHYAYPSKWVERTAALVPSTLTTTYSGLYQALGSVGVLHHSHVSVVVAYPSNQMALSIALVQYHLFGTLPWRWDLW